MLDFGIGYICGLVTALIPVCIYYLVTSSQSPEYNPEAMADIPEDAPKPRVLRPKKPRTAPPDNEKALRVCTPSYVKEKIDNATRGGGLYD